MRHGSTSRRSRNRNKKNNNKSRVYDSNGPDVRIRGTAHQIFDKYVALAKDASGAGDYVLAESYLQYAEHYQRIITDWHQIVQDAERGIDIDAEDYNVYGDSKPRRQQQSSQKRRDDNAGNKKESNNSDLGLPESITGEKEQQQGQLEDA